MKIFPVIVKKIFEAGGFIAGLNEIGFKFNTLLRAFSDPINIGIKILQPPYTLLIQNKPALIITLKGIIGSLVNQITNIGFKVNTRISHLITPTVPAFEIVQIQWDLLRTAYINEALTVSGTWTNPNNSRGDFPGWEAGGPDGNYATSTGDVLAGSRELGSDYKFRSPWKDAFTITKVEVYIWASATGNVAGLLGSVSFALDWITTDGSNKVVIPGWDQRTDNFDFTVTPDIIDITSLTTWDWDKLNIVHGFFLHEYEAASLTFTVSLDTIAIVVTANHTQTV